MQEFLDRTIVRVWASRANSEHDGKGVGHVSIELLGADNDNHYISLFPKDLTALRAITHTIPNKFHTLEEDIRIEERPPEILLCFYSFNHDFIIEKFESIKRNITGWSVVGNPLKMEEFWRTESCASLAYKVLQAGDSRSLLPTLKDDSKQAAKGSPWLFRSPSYCSELTLGALVTSPDSFAKVLKQMKLDELKKRPELKDVQYEGETTDLDSNNTAWCSVM